MALTKEAKQKATKSFGKHETDTGSPEVQIAILTKRINELTDHLRQFTVPGPLEMESDFAFAGLFGFGNLPVARAGLWAELLEGVE